MPDRRTLGRWARRSVQLPPHVVARKALAKATDTLAAQRMRHRDRTASTYAKSTGSLARYWPELPLEALSPVAAAAAGLTSNYLEHRFDLLGSGWVEVRHGMTPAGVEGFRYPPGEPVRPDAAGAWLDGRLPSGALSRARSVWSLVDASYQPIDWLLDVKSGWRWSEHTWYRDITVGGAAGADIKVPWELGRLEHLPQLAIAAGLARAGAPGFHPAQTYEREFRNQTLDFIATNPPRFGANWALAMDVAIRVANLVVARDLFLAGGAAFDAPFEAVLAGSVLDHGRHIAANLEWVEEIHGNHYLADVAGLLFAAGYLPRSHETDAWFAFAVKELLLEGAHQFWPDGANFEASTCYHRLSAEMLAWSVALLAALPTERLEALTDPEARRFHPARDLTAEAIPVHPQAAGLPRPVPAWLATRLVGMASFTRDATKPNGRVVQIGDNDSGRFLKLVPPVRRMTVVEARDRYANLDGAQPDEPAAEYWFDDALDHRDLPDVIDALLDGQNPQGAEGALARALVRDSRLPYDHSLADAAGRVLVGGDEALAGLTADREGAPAGHWRVVRIAIAGASLRDGLTARAYPDFGLWLLRSRRVWLAIHCGPVGQQGLGGHAHHDQLAIELSVDGDDWLRDPGTYLYTPAPERRNAYRASTAHAGPRLRDREPGPLGSELFVLGSATEGRCLAFTERGFAGEVPLSARATIYGMVELEDHAVVVSHWTKGLPLAPPHGALDDWRCLRPLVPFSPGYGYVERA